MISLQNKTVFITGGSRGIGAACVKLFHQAGATVAFSYNENESAAKTLINSFSSNLPLSVKIDFSSEKDIVEKVNLILDENLDN